MFLQLPHKKTTLYIASKTLLYQCYELSYDIATDDKNLICEQLKKAALMGHTAVTKALLSKKKKKKKLFKEAVEAFIMVDAALEIILELGWRKEEEMGEMSSNIQALFNALTNRSSK